MRIALASIAVVALAVAISCPARAQVAAAAAVAGVHLTVGVEGSYFATYYQTTRAYAAGGYADLDTRFGLGAEGEARFIRFHLPQGEAQDTYLAGLRYRPFHLPRIQPYVKLLAGDGEMTYPNNIGHGSYFVMEGGVGVDVRLTRHLMARGEYDGQYWPSAPAFPGEQNSEPLKPNGGSIGLAWRFF